MPANPERELARLRVRFEHHAHDLAQVGFFLKGSLVQRFKQCGSPGCSCHDDPPQLHGPYWQWTSKIKGKTVTRLLKDEEVARYREWIENARRMDQIVHDLQQLSRHADQILRGSLRRSPPPAKTPS